MPTEHFQFKDLIVPAIVGVASTLSGAIALAIRKRQQTMQRIETLERIAEKDALQMTVLRDTQQNLLSEMKGLRSDMNAHVEANAQQLVALVTSLRGPSDAG